LDAITVYATTPSTSTPTSTYTPSPTVTSPPPLSAGTYDDGYAQISYGTGWIANSVSGNYYNTEHYSGTLSSIITFKFSGVGFKLIYRKHSLFGNMTVSVDGTSAGTISQYSASLLSNQEWSSPTYTSGTHTVTLTHSSGTYTVLDAITVYATTPSTSTPTSTYTPSPTVTSPPPLSAGTYDDGYAQISYGTGWITNTVSGNYSSTEHYSGTLSSTITFKFSGVGFKLIYRKHPLFGNMTVSVDGTSAGTISQYSTSVLSRQEWSSPTYTSGTHTVTLTHSSGTYTVLDAITILSQ
jgi:hypothetical protein